MNELMISNFDGADMKVSGRHLHMFLLVKTRYNDWFARMLEYGFQEGKDYYSKMSNRSDGKAGKPQTDHELTLDMAKELCMLQRTDRGKEARQYFIQIEKEWNSPEKLMARALIAANKQLEFKSQQVKELTETCSQQQQMIGELKPKADYVDRILKSDSLVTITQIAKDYGMSGKAMNKALHDLHIIYNCNRQWLLYSQHQAKGYTFSETVDIPLDDGTSKVVMNTKWTQKGRLFLYEMLKKHGVIPLIEKQIGA